jgi:uncharacterized delta-60 repeat protein
MTVAENAGTVEIGVVRDGPTNLTSSARYFFQGAQTNRVVAAEGLLVFGPGVHRQTITVTILDDPYVSSGLQYATGLVLSPQEGVSPSAAADIMVEDNEFAAIPGETAPVRFFPGTPAAEAGADAATFWLRRVGESATSLTLRLTTVNGSAMAGVHFVAQNSVPISFVPLETEKLVQIPLLKGPVQGRETSFDVVLSGTTEGISWTHRSSVRLVNTTLPGTVDVSLRLGKVQSVVPDWGSVLEDVALMSDGRIYIGGHLRAVEGVPKDGIARLLPDGRLDPSFEEHAREFALQGDVHRMYLLPGGRLLAGYYGDARFFPDGSGDPSWSIRPSVLGVFPDGGVLVFISDDAFYGIRRYGPDGSRDPRFGEIALQSGEPKVLVEDDGRVLLTGAFFKDRPNQGWVRLLPDGTLDPSFSPDSTLQSAYIGALVRQPDGRYLVAGSKRDGVPPTVFRIHADGTWDNSFVIPTDLFDANNTLFWSVDLAVQPDGKILVAGSWNSPLLKSYYRGILRLNPDGSLDTSFDVGTGIGSGWIRRIILQPDGAILVAGTFEEFDGFPRSHLVRLNGDGKLLRILPPSLTAGGKGEFRVQTGGRTLDRIEIQATTDLSQPNWQTVRGRWDPGDPPTFALPEQPGASTRFYRAIGR